MKYAFAAAFVLGSALSAQAFGIHIGVDLSEDAPNAVLCELNGATLLAEKAADCATAGGTVSHELSTVKK